MEMFDSELTDLMVFEPKVFRDERGYFLETFRASAFRQSTGLDLTFVQDNHSRSKQFVLRGLHYQIRQTQGKLVSVVRGSVFDVSVDLRKSSPGFGRWFGVEISDSNHRHVWIPPGFAHGFLVLSEQADLLYKVTDYYAPEHERCIRWDDKDLNIAWPVDAAQVLLSDKDRQGAAFADAEVFE